MNVADPAAAASIPGNRYNALRSRNCNPLKLGTDGPLPRPVCSLLGWRHIVKWLRVLGGLWGAWAAWRSYVFWMMLGRLSWYMSPGHMSAAQRLKRKLECSKSGAKPPTKTKGKVACRASVPLVINVWNASVSSTGHLREKILYCRAVTTNCWLAPCHNRVILQDHSKTYQLCSGKHLEKCFLLDTVWTQQMKWRCLEENLEPMPARYMPHMFWFNSWIPKDGRIPLWFLSVIVLGYMIYPIYHVNLSLSLPIVACLLKYLPNVASYLHPNVTSLYHNVTSHYIPICPIRGETKL